MICPLTFYFFFLREVKKKGWLENMQTKRTVLSDDSVCLISFQSFVCVFKLKGFLFACICFSCHPHTVYYCLHLFITVFIFLISVNIHFKFDLKDICCKQKVFLPLRLILVFPAVIKLVSSQSVRSLMTEATELLHAGEVSFM